MTPVEVESELQEMMERARNSDGYFVTITRKNGDTLTHWQGSVKFPTDDRPHSLVALMEQVQ